jgi:hypothetical protein
MHYVRSHYPDVELHRPEINFYNLIKKKKMLPLRQARYCCQYLKEPYVVAGGKKESPNGTVAYKYLPNIVFPAGQQPDKWENKRYMAAKHARFFIEITGVRAERLNEISTPDCIKEGVIGWLLDWAEKETIHYEQDYQHWINDRLHENPDPSISYCKKCGEKEVRKLKKDATKAGATEKDLDDIFLDGGWSQESNHVSLCEGCGKRLEFIMCGDLEEYLKERDYELNKYSAYIIKQYDKEVLEKIQGLPRAAYAALIDSIHKKGVWESNPFVWCYDYKLTNKKSKI